MNKIIIAHNQDNLPTVKYTDFIDLQGDLKTLPKENQEKLKNSIINYGIRFPAFIWQSEGKKYIVDAHQRKKVFAILEKEGWTIPEVPYTNIFAKNKKEAAELLLQANSRYGEYNPTTSFFEDMQIDLSFIENIEIPELDIKLEDLESEIVEDVVPEPPIEPLSKTGDLWLCGKHRILCGDATKEADILKLMDGKKADLVFTDPPYGMNLDTDWSDLKSDRQHDRYGKKYPKVIGDDKNFNIGYFLNLFENVKEQIWWGADYYNSKLPEGGSWFVWDKRADSLEFDGKPDKMIGSAFELCWSKTKHKREIIRVKWAGWWGLDTDIRLHPTQKPVQLVVYFLNKFSKENDIIADFFLGSGTTLIAAHQTGRICYGCEIDPHYIDVILDRYAKFTGDDCIRESDGVKWSELKSSSEKRTD